MSRNEWICPKPDCDIDIDGHDFALFLDHLHHDEPKFTSEDAQQVADRTIARLERNL